MDSVVVTECDWIGFAQFLAVSEKSLSSQQRARTEVEGETLEVREQQALTCILILIHKCHRFLLLSLFVVLNFYFVLLHVN